MKEINVALIGCKFMGKAHSNAWKNVAHFFDLNRPARAEGCVRHERAGPGRVRGEMGMGGNRNRLEKGRGKGRHPGRRRGNSARRRTGTSRWPRPSPASTCSAKSPSRSSAAEAGEMVEAAEKHGVVHYLNHEYRRCPAVALARQLIDEGRIGRIFHWRGAYLQSWLVDPNFPLTWHLRKETAGSGAQAGINSHCVDLARYLVGEIRSVVAMKTTFVPERPLPSETAGTFQAAGADERRKGKGHRRRRHLHDRAVRERGTGLL